MATIKVTFTLDQATAQILQNTADRLSRTKATSYVRSLWSSMIVWGRLSGRARLAMLRIFDEVVPKIPDRSAGAVDRELKEIWQARKAGGRRTPLVDQQ